MDDAQRVSVASRDASARDFARELWTSPRVWLAFGLGLALTALWSFWAGQRRLSALQLDFEQRAAAAAAHIERSFLAPLEALHAIHSVELVFQDIDQLRFEQFAGRLLERYPSVAALELFKIVPGSERAALEQRASEELGRPFTFQEPAPDGSGKMVRSPARDQHVVLMRLVPYRSDLHGLDLTFEPLRRAQIKEATLAGEKRATAKFRLIEDPPEVYSVAVYDPIYTGGAPPAAASERERQVRGFAVALYRIAPLMDEALVTADLAGAEVALFDLDPALSGQGALLFGSARALAAHSGPRFDFRRELDFSGRKWALALARPAPSVLLASPSSWAVGGTGSLLFALLVGLGTSLGRSRRRFQDLKALGPYTLVREIGAGGMGRVFEARHELLRRRAAVKVIARERATDEQLRRFEIEARITSELTHPNTVVVFDYGRTRRDDFYYVMEYVHGIDFEHLVRRYGAQTPERVRHLLLQVCGALSEAHGLGLVHRDVKPANLMLGVRGGIFDFVKVLDFGLVKVTHGAGAGRSVPGVILGTPRYMAPESFASSHAAGPRADLYALGCVAYLLLTGRDVFVAHTDSALAAAHLTQAPLPLGEAGAAGVPPELERIVLRCLSKNPEQRFTSAAELGRALSRLDLSPWTQAEAAAFWAEHEAAGVSAAPSRAS